MGANRPPADADGADPGGSERGRGRWRTLRRISGPTGPTHPSKESLAAKCQENGWLRAGGYAWQDDPYLEDYPYDIREASSMEELRSFFRRGNWAIRQGVVYRDLAFVQQVDGGDEWWTLKKIGDGGEPGDWLAFENCSFGGLSRDRHGFNDLIVGMSAASASECERLEIQASHARRALEPL